MSLSLGRFLLYAPNVHTGGGFVLLQAILRSWPSDLPFFAWLDVRAQPTLDLPDNFKVEWVSPSFSSRLKSEINLANEGASNDRVLCFHGLPPLLRNRAKIIVFLQNRNYLGLVPLKDFTWRTRQRLRFEQMLTRKLIDRCSEYWVQTPSMARELKKVYGEKSFSVRVLAFSQSLPLIDRSEKVLWDFLYPADGEAHKNHRSLVQAWVLLSQNGCKPSLALTLTLRDVSLIQWIEKQITAYGLSITILGHLPFDELVSVYGKSRALIFPSISESFGLPLIEARQTGLPILASELDFVRDVCEPVQTFDPNSPTSIARAVRRFIGEVDIPLNPVSPSEFLTAVRVGLI